MTTTGEVCPNSEDGLHLGVDGVLYKLSVKGGRIWAHLKGYCDNCGCTMYFTQKLELDDEHMSDSLDEVVIDGAREFRL